MTRQQQRLLSQARLHRARLGHSSITLTLDTYTHVVPGMQELASSRLETLLATPAVAAAQG